MKKKIFLSRLDKVFVIDMYKSDAWAATMIASSSFETKLFLVKIERYLGIHRRVFSLFEVFQCNGLSFVHVDLYELRMNYVIKVDINFHLILFSGVFRIPL